MKVLITRTITESFAIPDNCLKLYKEDEQALRDFFYVNQTGINEKDEIKITRKRRSNHNQ